MYQYRSMNYMIITNYRPKITMYFLARKIHFYPMAYSSIVCKIINCGELWEDGHKFDNLRTDNSNKSISSQEQLTNWYSIQDLSFLK